MGLHARWKLISAEIIRLSSHLERSYFEITNLSYLDLVPDRLLVDL
jgi:hypothetical protein